MSTYHLVKRGSFQLRVGDETKARKQTGTFIKGYRDFHKDSVSQNKGNAKKNRDGFMFLALFS